MLIRRLRIEDFRKLRGPVCIDGIGNGITVIAGDNEEGKSTVLQALRAVLFCRHGSDGVEAKQMLPNGGGGQPRIELDFSIDGRDYRLCKTFLQRPKQAVLTTPARTFSGGEAEEELQRLLGLDFGKQGLSKPEEQGVCGLLWVEQGTGFAAPLIGDNGRRALGRALEQELDQVVGGDRAAAVIEAVEERYSRFFQPKRGREKGVYAEAKQKVEDLEAECARLREQARSYDALLAELEQVRAALSAHAEAGGIERAQADVHRLDAAQRRLDDLRVKRDAVEAAEKLACSKLDIAVQRQQARAERVNAQLRTQQEAVRSAVELKEAERALAPLEEALSRAEAEAAEADRAVAQAQSRDDAADRALMRARAAHDLAALTIDLRLAKEAAAAAERLRSEAAAIIVDDGALRRLRDATTAVDKARARVQAAETRVEFAPIAGRRAFLGADAVPTNRPLRLDEPTTLRLEGWGELTIVPGGEDLAERRAAVTIAEEALAGLLMSLGVADAAAAEAACSRRRELTAVAAEAARDLARRAPEGLEALRLAVAVKAAEEADLAQGATAAPLLPEAAEAERRQARQLRRFAASARASEGGLEQRRPRPRSRTRPCAGS
ncbi:MAG: AAA family ATPase [Rhodospirillales bacterium]|nr:AAA family ATPase [Rhodospirillales bacterium]